ncbi:head-tail connector protein [Pseudomonas phage vB_PpuM-SKa-4]
MISIEVYFDNLLRSSLVADVAANGKVSAVLPANTLLPNFEPYQVVYKQQGSTNYSTQRLYMINPSMLTAIDELRQFTNRINSKLRLDDLAFTDEDYLNCLKAGRDMFNGAVIPTGFSMINAQGAIYALWIKYAEHVALRTMYMDEGRTQFDYQGAAVQLTMDMTQYLESQDQSVMDYIQANVESIKTFLNRVGITKGDGSEAGGNGKGRRKHVPGATGVSAGPLSSYWGALDSRLNNFPR